MLDSLRVFAKSWPGKIMGGFLLVGVAGFGINNVITDLGSNSVAKVGSTDVSTRKFLRAYQNQINQFGQQFGIYPTAEQAQQFGIPTMVLQNLFQEAALDQIATDFGLGVSADKLGQLLREDPSFSNALGVFEPSAFQQVLRNSGLTENEYFTDTGNSARRQQLILGLFGDTALPAAAADLINQYNNEQRSIEYFTLGETNIDTQAEPTEDELAAYLKERQAEFRTVETRKVQMLRLSPADLAKTIEVSDSAVEAEYERTKGNLTAAERRTVQQLPLNAEQTSTFEAGLAAGTSFETLVADNGLTPVKLGTLSKAGITDANLANAAFGLESGKFTLIDGIGGKRAIYVSAIEGGGTPALADVRDQVRESLALTQARNQLADIQDQIEELRAAFRPLTEIAERFNLDLYEAGVTASGAELSVLPGIGQEDSARLVQTIFKSEQGALTPSTQLAGNGHLWFDLQAIEPVRDQTLDEVRDQVAEALTTQRINDAILKAQQDAVARLDKGESIADVAAAYNVFPQFSTPFTRQGTTDSLIDSLVASEVFAGGKNHHGAAVSQTGDFVVFAVTDVTEPSEVLADAQQEVLENDVRVGLYGAYVSAVREDVGYSINETALQQALTLNTGL